MTLAAARLDGIDGSSASRKPDLRSLRPWLAGFALWTVLGLLSATETAVFFAREGQPIQWTPLLVERLTDWYSCGVFTPLFFIIARRFPVDRDRWRDALPVNLAVVAASVPVKYLIYIGVMHSILPTYRYRTYDTLFFENFISEAMAFAAVVGVIHAIVIDRRERQRAEEAAKLETLLAESRLEALTAQLQPHFLFNTLHSVSTLMHRDVEAADSMIARLGDLLRQTLDSRGHPEHSLADEVRFLDAYLDIMNVRFGDRLSTEVTIAPEAATARVPRFLLQPLVENAIQHGVGNRPGPGRIQIDARIDNDRLLLTIADDGGTTRLSGSSFPREGIGLWNTRERLRTRFGDDHDLRLVQTETGGLRVEIDVPRITAHA